jgi:hypothetical protein
MNSNSSISTIGSSKSGGSNFNNEGNIERSMNILRSTHIYICICKYIYNTCAPSNSVSNCDKTLSFTPADESPLLPVYICIDKNV